jgi:hypothetical protein
LSFAVQREKDFGEAVKKIPDGMKEEVCTQNLQKARSVKLWSRSKKPLSYQLLASDAKFAKPAPACKELRRLKSGSGFHLAKRVRHTLGGNLRDRH